MFGGAFLGWRTPACHPEQSERYNVAGSEILRFAQDDSAKPIRLSSPDMQMGQAFSGWGKPHPYSYTDMAYGEVPTICS